MKIIGDHDWDLFETLFKNADPFPSICIDNFLDRDFASQVAAAYPTYATAQSVGLEFGAVNEKLKVQITDPVEFPDPVKKLSEALAGEDLRGRLARMSGIDHLNWDPTFAGGGMHLTASTGLLDVHVDFNYLETIDLYRRLNILIYLNPEWNDSWGGQVELWNRDVTKCIQSFSPIHNRCIIFETSDFSFHGVNEVRSPAGVTRNSFAAYYYSTEPGNNKGQTYNGTHSTIFKARPSEKMKNYVFMPLEKASTKLEEGKNAAKKRLKRLISKPK